MLFSRLMSRVNFFFQGGEDKKRGNFTSIKRNKAYKVTCCEGEKKLIN